MPIRVRHEPSAAVLSGAARRIGFAEIFQRNAEQARQFAQQRDLQLQQLNARERSQLFQANVNAARQQQDQLFRRFQANDLRQFRAEDREDRQRAALEEIEAQGDIREGLQEDQQQFLAEQARARAEAEAAGDQVKAEEAEAKAEALQQRTAFPKEFEQRQRLGELDFSKKELSPTQLKPIEKKKQRIVEIDEMRDAGQINPMRAAIVREGLVAELERIHEAAPNRKSALDQSMENIGVRSLPGVGDVLVQVDLKTGKLEEFKTKEQDAMWDTYKADMSLYRTELRERTSNRATLAKPAIGAEPLSPERIEELLGPLPVMPTKPNFNQPSSRSEEEQTETEAIVDASIAATTEDTEDVAADKAVVSNDAAAALEAEGLQGDLEPGLQNILLRNIARAREIMKKPKSEWEPFEILEMNTIKFTLMKFAK